MEGGSRRDVDLAARDRGGGDLLGTAVSCPSGLVLRQPSNTTRCIQCDDGAAECCASRRCGDHDGLGARVHCGRDFEPAELQTLGLQTAWWLALDAPSRHYIKRRVNKHRTKRLALRAPPEQNLYIRLRIWLYHWYIEGGLAPLPHPQAGWPS